MNKKTSDLTKGGIFTGVGVLLVYLSSIVPTSKLFLLLLACSVITLSVITTGIKNSYMVFLSTTMLSFLITGIKLQTVLYLLLFGIYSLVKAHIESIRKLPIELALKFLFFNFSTFTIFGAYKLFLFNFNIKYSFVLLYGVALVLFAGMDYVLTLYIVELRKVLSRLNKKGGNIH